METEFLPSNMEFVEGELEEIDASPEFEGDETISLSDILSSRDFCLSEEELWALCRECCLVLDVVKSSPEMFQTLCITPDTVAFDGSGNVCFLDLETEPEQLYIPPEYEHNEQSYKSHLFSLGMTLLYAAEYNGEPGRPEITAELRQLFGYMTSEKPSDRPDLESLINQCEEELVGKSSADICCKIGSFTAHFSPAPDGHSSSLADVTAGLANYLQSQSKLLPDSSALNITDPQQHSTPAVSPDIVSSANAEEDMALRGNYTGIPTATGNLKQSSPHNRKNKNRTLSGENEKDNIGFKPPIPRKPDLKKQLDNDSGVIDMDLSNNNDNNNENMSKFKPVPQKRKHSDSVQTNKEKSDSNKSEKSNRSKKRQGYTITEILETIDRNISEEELWAICKEGAYSLQRKKKHLPAYLSLDTLLVRDNGSISFRAIPEDKPLEVMFMSPELQQKGELSEKACLYGLGTTLRCTGGAKHSSVSSLGISSELKELLSQLVHPDMTQRPSIEDTLEICGIHDGRTGESSALILQQLFQDAQLRLIEQEENSIKHDMTQEIDMGSAFRPIKTTVESAFVPKKPVPVKPDEPSKTIPTAYRSTATHFKPIVLHRTETPVEKKEVKKEKSPTNDCQPSEKDKEVVKKLKELKKNLMKHRQPSGGKDDEVEPSTPPRSPKPKSKQYHSPKKSSTQKSSNDDSHEEKSNKKDGMGALENLLSEVQKRGTQVDTDTLASAIAQHLQNFMGKSEQKPSQVDTADWVQNQNNQFMTPQMPPPQMWPNLNIPSQYQQHVVGQTVTLPQYGGGMVPGGYPMQVQLQQDPRTGFVQLVPVGMPVPFQQPTVNDYGYLSDSAKSQKMHGNFTVLNQSPLNTSGDMDSSPNASRSGRPGRAAKNLLQKTANMRAKNTGRVHSARHVDHSAETSNLWRSKSAHMINDEHFHSDGEAIKRHSSHLSAFEIKPGSYDDTVLHRGNHQNIQFDSLQHSSNQHIPHKQSGADNQVSMQPPISESQSSSPSASKDSGISSVNGAYKPPAAGSMVERLLNNVHSSQQEKLGRVIHLLREEFAFDGYMENGVEDLATAEYIASLGNLKWETFASAITEKYCDIYWAPDLLMSLYDSVNASNRSPQVQPTVLEPSVQVQNQRDLPSQRPLSLHQRLHQPETSDSTDNENYERRRRPRRKHHHDKSKNSSFNNVSEQNVPNNIDRLSDDTLVSDNSNDKLREREATPDRDVSKNNIPMENNPLRTLGNNSDSQRSYRSHESTEESNKSDSQTEKSEHGIYRKNKKTNQNRVFSADSGMLSKGSNLTRHLSQLSLVDNVRTEIPLHTRKCNVVYHYATMQLNFSPDMEKFVQSIVINEDLEDEENASSLQSELSALEQQVMMEKRQKKKTENFYFKLTESSKSDKGEQKSTLLQVCKDLDEMAAKIHFLQLCQTHLQMSVTELSSIHPTYLYSVVTCDPDQPLKLKPCQDNPLLQFQILREPQTGCEIQALHAGMTDGLMSYLFSSTALSFGYIHQYLFCYRYFVSQTDVMNFLITKYRSAKGNNKSGESNLTRLRQRVLDVLYFWVEGFYSVDFDDNSDLIDTLQNFLEEAGIKPSSEYEEPSLQDLLNSCLIGQNIDLSSTATEDNIHVYKPGTQKKDNSEEPQWDTLKSVVKSKSNKSVLPHVKPGPVKPHRRGSVDLDLKLSRRTENFTLADYTPQKLAEQLTLIEQGLFQQTHPVHYLNSKSQGVGVSLTLAKSRAPSTFKLNSPVSENQTEYNLFVCDIRNESNMQQMIEFSNQVSHWVAAEIVSCSSVKSQTAVLSKLLFTAQTCKDMRNYATCMSILEGLENLVIKQLPIWKNLSAKCVAVMEELTTTRIFLKSDVGSLLSNKDSHMYPTIPSVVLLLLHIQQCEIGGFKLANGMYKWSKMRSICNAIDQVRIFKNHLYGFDPEIDLQEVLVQRMKEFCDQDVHQIAAQHDTNYHRMSSGGIVGAFRKMKGKLQSK
ncbi:kinase non-catalytic C-lobe domain-containing protein 1-like isoform X4 [Mytilus galloprovincialis]|uniref:kinase non-catalytic C-lobe domain-containing protein 1-like isoform X4 n=1 Tax=Mytilus galloprovincialis TaxID=29158 RepID=UPI003F7CA4E1